MKLVLRYGLALVAGLAVVVACVMAIETLGHTVYPVPPGIEIDSPQEMARYVQALPSGALLFVLFGWVIGAFAGGVVAAWAARSRPLIFCSVIAAFILAGAVTNLFMIPHPIWFTVLSLVSIVFTALLAARMAVGRSGGG